MEHEFEQLKAEFRAAMTAERHDAAACASTALLDILTVSYRTDLQRWEDALELWHWAQRTARAQRSHLNEERKAVRPANAYGCCKIRVMSTFSLDA
ncbi:hypothetical protein [Paludibaculum fermentans]|uniref:Uncharacterized protein n=1 Tax=Paludibaculum fermentans TaxID=1473598 RepID=A0A7S7SIJ3_PALFE|nr:hypothetical protein [Paludibaculum fermentans]QOY85521.1 hypothetical protein IRI77_22135 [Paludibaculum fermentans]